MECPMTPLSPKLPVNAKLYVFIIFPTHAFVVRVKTVYTATNFYDPIAASQTSQQTS